MVGSPPHSQRNAWPWATSSDAGASRPSIGRRIRGLWRTGATYLSDRVDASRWGTAPLSIRTPSTLDLEAHERIDTVGFPVHGPETGLNRTVWHTASNGPTTAEAWWDLGEQGGCGIGHRGPR